MFDVGTNNYLNMSTARADFPPNGVDFPAGPTGRVSNGRNMADYIETQISQMESVARDLQTVYNSSAAATYLSRCVYYIEFEGGSIVNQLDSLMFTDPPFIERVASEYINFVQALYAIGARKFGVLGPPQIGCTPAARATSPIGACSARANSIAAAIPSRLVLATSMLRVTNPDIDYSIANTYNIIADITNSPALFGK
ncbi:GDSL esterase/lipase At5g37690 [Linum grandiflorum]